MSNSPLQRPSVLIRNAVEKDAVAIIQAHYDAVHITAAKDYDEAILNEWSAFTNDRVKKLEIQINNNPENTIMLVAEIDKNVVGFGEIVPSNQELRAVYVSPKTARRGVGKALLQELEAIARAQGVTRLWLDSSLTAVPFYLAHGYVSDWQGEHQLRSGQKMACVKMHKILGD